VGRSSRGDHQASAAPTVGVRVLPRIGSGSNRTHPTHVTLGHCDIAAFPLKEKTPAVQSAAGVFIRRMGLCGEPERGQPIQRVGITPAHARRSSSVSRICRTRPFCTPCFYGAAHRARPPPAQRRRAVLNLRAVESEGSKGIHFHRGAVDLGTSRNHVEFKRAWTSMKMRVTNPGDIASAEALKPSGATLFPNGRPAIGGDLISTFSFGGIG
jgi:hypothetical protein